MPDGNIFRMIREGRGDFLERVFSECKLSSFYHVCIYVCLPFKVREQDGGDDKIVRDYFSMGSAERRNISGSFQ
jgi:hypothetical protein